MSGSALAPSAIARDAENYARLLGKELNCPVYVCWTLLFFYWSLSWPLCFVILFPFSLTYRIVSSWWIVWNENPCPSCSVSSWHHSVICPHLVQLWTELLCLTSPVSWWSRCCSKRNRKLPILVMNSSHILMATSCSASPKRSALWPFSPHTMNDTALKSNEGIKFYEHWFATCLTFTSR